jgi:hypothetical protein
MNPPTLFSMALLIALLLGAFPMAYALECIEGQPPSDIIFVQADLKNPSDGTIQGALMGALMYDAPESPMFFYYNITHPFLSPVTARLYDGPLDGRAPVAILGQSTGEISGNFPLLPPNDPCALIEGNYRVAVGEAPNRLIGILKYIPYSEILSGNCYCEGGAPQVISSPFGIGFCMMFRLILSAVDTVSFKSLDTALANGNFSINNGQGLFYVEFDRDIGDTRNVWLYQGYPTHETQSRHPLIPIPSSHSYFLEITDNDPLICDLLEHRTYLAVSSDLNPVAEIAARVVHMDFGGEGEGEGEGEGQEEGEGEGEGFPQAFQLTINITGSGQVAISPPSVDGFYPPFTPVLLTATPGSGYQFMGWSGPDAAALESVYESHTVLVMSGNQSVRANFIATPPLIDPDENALIYHVAPPPLGQDAPGRGTAAAPYATIAYALDRIIPTGVPMRIQAASGVYSGNLTLKPGVTVASEANGEVWIEGSVTGAANSALERVRLTSNAKSTYLLDMNNVAMTLTGVWFVGGPGRTETGILADGEAPANSIIDGCHFSSLSVGIDIGGAIPTIRRCVFENLADSAIVVRHTAGKSFEAKAIGDETDPTSGWNTFRNNIDGPAIVNERDETLIMQMNDWDTNDPSEIAARIEGPATYVPYLAQGNGLLAASIFCTVVDNTGQTPILNASVRLLPSGYNPVTNNDKGVYAYPAIPEGSYTLQITAPDYQTASRAVNVSGGVIATVTVPLSAGEKPPQCACSGNDKALPAPGDLFIGTLSVLVLLLLKNPVQRHRN